MLRTSVNWKLQGEKFWESKGNTPGATDNLLADFGYFDLNWYI
jgi:hypothetical protein